jgi:putative hydrolase of the HAD superfamily
MNNKHIKAIIFDLGNVVIDFDHTIAAKRISRFTTKSPQEIFNLFFDSQLTGLFEEGKISSFEFFSRVREILNLKLDYEQFLPIWNDIFFLTEKNQAVYNLAKTLKKQYKIALLSNINILHFDYLKKNFSVFDAFHNIITSFESGFRKPHPFIYQKTSDILGALPYNIFYTDDRPELVESACRLGICGFIFKNISQLKKDLLGNGIRIN